MQEAAWHDTEALRAQLEGARASMHQAEAAVESTRVALTQMVIRAPMTGMVVDRAVEPGQSVGAGSPPLLTVVDNSHLECASNVDQRFAPQVHRAMRAVLRTPLDPRATLVGTVTDVIPAGDPKTLTVRLRLEVDNHEHRLMDGVSVKRSDHPPRARGRPAPTPGPATCGSQSLRTGRHGPDGARAIRRGLLRGRDLVRRDPRALPGGTRRDRGR